MNTIDTSTKTVRVCSDFIQALWGQNNLEIVDLFKLTNYSIILNFCSQHQDLIIADLKD